MLYMYHGVKQIDERLSFSEGPYGKGLNTTRIKRPYMNLKITSSVKNVHLTKTDILWKRTVDLDECILTIWS